jgi:hypothetical protein
MSESQIAALFPRLGEHGFTVTSPQDNRYNCIAWAAGDDTRWWWPGVIAQPIGGYYWPTRNLREAVDNFESAFATLGYMRCETKDYEPGYEKVAIYVGADGSPTHAARQTRDGRWVSKLGKLEDICHSDIEGVCGERYGQVRVILRREVMSSSGRLKRLNEIFLLVARFVPRIPRRRRIRASGHRVKARRSRSLATARRVDWRGRRGRRDLDDWGAHAASVCITLLARHGELGDGESSCRSARATDQQLANLMPGSCPPADLADKSGRLGDDPESR